jgi:hypothetical protein
MLTLLLRSSVPLPVMQFITLVYLEKTNFADKVHFFKELKNAGVPTVATTKIFSLLETYRANAEIQQNEEELADEDGADNDVMIM